MKRTGSALMAAVMLSAALTGCTSETPADAGKRMEKGMDKMEQDAEELLPERRDYMMSGHYRADGRGRVDGRDYCLKDDLTEGARKAVEKGGDAMDRMEEKLDEAERKP